STRLTRNRAAALAKDSNQQPLADSTQQQSYPPPANPYPYLTDDQVPDSARSYSNSVHQSSVAYQYPPHAFQAADGPTSPSSGGSTSPNAAATSAAAANHPINHPHIPVSGMYMAGPYPPHLLVPAHIDGYPLEDISPPTVYGGASSISMGTEIMRVPSASPSIASGELEPLGSPGPDDYPSGFDASARSSSNPRSNYDYPGSGPISPLSSTFAPQPLPSTFSSVTSGYLHGPAEPQSALPSSAFSASPDGDLLPSVAASTNGGPVRGGRQGQKTKTKLTDMDRKFICVFAQNHPKARQEDIATKFAVERSTVSKILKCKEKWMKVDFFSSEARVVKHRPSKFPELEATLIDQIRLRQAAREPVNDSFIKKMALELAQERGIGKDKFKASSGWVENFKHRHDLRKGGSWDRASNAAAWANSAAKYGVPGSTAAEAAAAANGQLSAPVAMSDDHSGGAGTGYGVAYALGTEGYVHGANTVGTEVSNPMDEDVLGTIDNNLTIGYSGLSHPHHESLSSDGQAMQSMPPPSQGPGSDNGSAYSDSQSQASGSFRPGENYPRGGSISPRYAMQAFLHPHSHLLNIPRSTSVASRSTSNSSVGSAASPVSANSPLLHGSQYLPSTSPSVAQYSPTQISPPPLPSHFHGHGPGHGHRRSMSASYTSSPLSIEVGTEESTSRPIPRAQSPRSQNRHSSYIGSTVTLQDIQNAATSPALRSSAARRSVTFSSFSAMAAGLSIQDGLLSPADVPPSPSFVHSRNVSYGSQEGSQSSYGLANDNTGVPHTPDMYGTEKTFHTPSPLNGSPLEPGFPHDTDHGFR
ncbi:hypothetical protein FRB90_000505, partial [Tulasnella sp. 427]